MTLQTQIEISPMEKQLSYADDILLLGSCFAENIGRQLTSYKFATITNPLGILYNPFSLAKSIHNSLDNVVVDIKQKEGVYFSLDYHSDVASTSESQTKELVSKGQNILKSSISQSKLLVVTFGTAWIYEDKDSNEVVGNCHQLPNALFNRRRLSVAEIVDQWIIVIDRIRKVNPTIQIVFTVSPVRHWKDGARENQISKSILHLAIEELCERASVFYFPSYEIVMDELRDYRFYAKDLLHINEQAIEHIWNTFLNYAFDSKSLSIYKRVAKLNQMIGHRSRFEGSDKDLAHKKATFKKIESLVNEFPFIDYSIEKENLYKLLIN